VITTEVVNDLLWAGLPLSVTVTVKVEVPDTLGVPEMRPDGDSEMPGGRAPEVRAQA
jgi:hypothetical protein